MELLIVDVLWTEEELKETNWEQDGLDHGWYRGEVQQYDEDEDMLYIFIL